MRLRRATAVLAASTAILGASAASAQAATTTWLAGTVNAGQLYGGSTFGSLTGSSAYAPSGHQIRVAARYSNGTMYSGWYGGGGSVCHPYPSVSLQPMLQNYYSSDFKMYGYALTGGTSC
ncbi:MAG: hypothetical protein AAGC46_02230 [Solirubrobacteraceae bacterium]|nr:hypothetical protein [Patulibacter sp.]